MMRLGGVILKSWSDADEWAALAKEMGYGAVYFPLDYRAPVNEIDRYVAAAKAADLVISEVGVWNNTLDRDPGKREAAVDQAVKQLELADYVGANCCVNIAGSYSEQWDGHHPANLTARAFEEIVETTQRIIDRVKPSRSGYSLEPMPWMYPDSADSYLELIDAIDREAFVAHIDPVNVITSPGLYYNNGAVIREWFEKLGDRIVSCHAKDIIMRQTLTVHLDECRPGLGNLDYESYLSCLATADDRVCLMLEHMSEEQDYIEAARYIRGVADRLGLVI